jgi:lipopolysaccharide export LptBFGC system permease protein LptF
MTVFHRHLMVSFVANLSRAILVLMVIVATVGLPAFFGGQMGEYEPRGWSLTALVAYGFAVFEFVLPLAMLLATLFTVGALARRHELTALRAAGWSLPGIVAPILWVSLGAVLLSVVLRVAEVSFVQSTASNAAAETARHARLAYPLANVLAAAVGVAIGASRRRRSLYVGFGRAQAVPVVYYIVSALMNALGRHGPVPPAVAGWSATVLFAGLAVILWRRAAR